MVAGSAATDLPKHNHPWAPRSSMCATCVAASLVWRPKGGSADQVRKPCGPTQQTSQRATPMGCTEHRHVAAGTRLDTRPRCGVAITKYTKQPANAEANVRHVEANSRRLIAATHGELEGRTPTRGCNHQASDNGSKHLQQSENNTAAHIWPCYRPSRPHAPKIAIWLSPAHCIASATRSSEMSAG